MKKLQLSLAITLCLLSGAVSLAAEDANNLLNVQNETQTSTQPPSTEQAAGSQATSEQNTHKDPKKAGMETGTPGTNQTPSLPTTTQRHD